MDPHSQNPTKKRGGARTSGAHLALLITSTLLLTLAGVFFIMGGHDDQAPTLMNILGVISLLAGIALRYIDTRI